MVCCGVMWSGWVPYGAFGSLIGWFVGSLLVGWLIVLFVVGHLVGWFIGAFIFGLLVGCWVAGRSVAWLGASTPYGVWCSMLLHGVRYGVRGCACMCSHCKVGGGGGLYRSNLLLLAVF